MIRFSKAYPAFLTVKEGSTFLTKPLFNSLYDPFGSPSRGQKPQGREDVTALRCSEPLRYKVGGPIKGLARLCGMGPHGGNVTHGINMLAVTITYRIKAVKPTYIYNI